MKDFIKQCIIKLLFSTGVLVLTVTICELIVKLIELLMSVCNNSINLVKIILYACIIVFVTLGWIIFEVVINNIKNKSTEIEEEEEECE